MIKISSGIFIAEDELVFKFSRGGGPGGQNVNKVNTRVTVLFDVVNSASFSDVQKEQILKGLASRADKNGVIRVVSQRYRTQKANRRAVVERLEELLKGALKKKPVRKKTKVPEAAKRERLERKKQRSFLKKQRAERSFELESVGERVKSTQYRRVFPAEGCRRQLTGGRGEKLPSLQRGVF